MNIEVNSSLSFFCFYKGMLRQPPTLETMLHASHVARIFLLGIQALFHLLTYVLSVTSLLNLPVFFSDLCFLFIFFAFLYAPGMQKCGQVNKFGNKTNFVIMLKMADLQVWH